MSFMAEHAGLVFGLLAVGFASGFTGGLFGVGGGIITTPALYALFQSLGVAQAPSLKTAVSTSLAVIVVTSVRSLGAHHRAGQVDWDVLRTWGPFIALGAGTGGGLARWAPVELLTIVFAAGAAFVAYRRLTACEDAPVKPRALDRPAIMIPVGVGTGLFSSLMGIGGGAMGVMILTMAGRSMHRAIATSAGFGVLVAVPGVIGFVVSGLWLSAEAAQALPPGSIGYVNAPAFMVMGLTAALAAPIGARAAHRLHGDWLSRVFGAYVLFAAFALVFDVFTG